MTTVANEVQVLSDLASADYHANVDRISNSMLGEAEESLELFYGRYIARNIPFKKQTPDMAFGTLFHDAVLLGIQSQAVLVPESVLDGVGKRNGAKFKEWAAEHAGKTMLMRDEWDRLARMVGATVSNKVARELLTHADAAIEQSIYWQDEATELKLKSRLDARRLSLPLIIDLKSVRSVKPNHLADSVCNFGYARQAVMYREAAKAAFGIPHDFVFIAVEKEAPHRVQCFDLPQRAMERGWDLFRGGLDRLALAFEKNDWQSPGVDRVLSIGLPNWAYNDQWKIDNGDGD